MTASALQSGQTPAAVNSDDNDQREFQLSDRDFQYIRNVVGRETGIVITEAKRQMVYSRLTRRLRSLNLKDFSAYCRLLEEDPEGELTAFINAITTNLTSFFREPHHFSHLQKIVVPELLKKNSASRRIRVWSAGCSTGEEPYSIAMALKEAVPSDSWDLRILATDIDTDVLAKAKAGVYPMERVTGIDQSRLKTWFSRGVRSHQGKVRVSTELSEIINFKQLNLMGDWPIKGPLDVLFCRNVVIYFDKETQRKIFKKFANLMASRAYLYIGHSESLFKISDDFELIGQTIYRKRY